jgi:hypothetical protein
MDRERGASLVEFALVLPLILMILLGLVSVGVAYNQKLALTHSARETARYGATLSVVAIGDLDAWLDLLAQRAFDGADLPDGTPGRYLCVAYVFPNGDAGSTTDRTRNRIEDQSGTISRNNAACPSFNDGRPADERRVQIQIERTGELNVLIFRTDLDLSSQAVTRFEAIDLPGES